MQTRVSPRDSEIRFEVVFPSRFPSERLIIHLTSLLLHPFGRLIGAVKMRRWNRCGNEHPIFRKPLTLPSSRRDDLQRPLRSALHNPPDEQLPTTRVALGHDLILYTLFQLWPVFPIYPRGGRDCSGTIVYLNAEESR